MLKLKRTALLFFLLLFATKGFPNDFTWKLFSLDFASRKTVTMVEELGGQVSRFKPGVYAEFYLSQALYDQLTSFGLNLSQINEMEYEKSNILSDYLSYEEVTNDLLQVDSAYSDLCLLSSIGQTVEGREMWIMKISDNVELEEAEPEIKLIAAMHGDEIVGQELMINLIHLLVEEYQHDPRIQTLVDENEIWVMPNMNFDGTAYFQQWGTNGRWNANGVNLNRNFPDREFGDPPYSEHLYDIQPETENMINFIADHNFILSANFHGGALLVNYPWDKKLAGDGGTGIYAATPDDDTFIDLALSYASKNPAMDTVAWPQNGIINGAEWYEVNGSMQDWNYFAYNCMDLTIELSETKWPDYATIVNFWEDNREALLSYMEKARTGIRGIVTDSISGLPLSAEVTLLETGSRVYSDVEIGDYYKIITPGLYSIQVSASNYETKNIYDISVDSINATTIDVQLAPIPTYEVSGIVFDFESLQALAGAQLIFKNAENADTILTNTEGIFALNLSENTYQIEILIEQYFALLDSIAVLGDTSLSFALQKIYPSKIAGELVPDPAVNVSGAFVFCQGIMDTIADQAYFEIENLIPGPITVFAVLSGYQTARLDTILLNGDSLHLTIPVYQGDNTVFLDFESDTLPFNANGDWESGLPESGPGNAHSGTKVWATVLDGNYTDGPAGSELISPELNLIGFVKPTLQFYQWYEFEAGYDGGNLKISLDQAKTWQIIHPFEGYSHGSLDDSGDNPLGGQPAFSGDQHFWELTTFDLENFSDAPTVQIKFDVGVNEQNNAAGWYIDDFLIIDANATQISHNNPQEAQQSNSVENFPNPFNAETRITVKLTLQEKVDISVFDIRGSHIRKITSQFYPPGVHTFIWDAKNVQGKSVATGVYFLKVHIGSSIIDRKMVLLR